MRLCVGMWQAWKHFKANAVSELVDVALGEEYDSEEVKRVVNLALSCTQDSASARPSMNSVVAILGNYTQDTANQLPNQPGFIPKTHSFMTSSSSNGSYLSSAYNSSSLEMTKSRLR